MDSRIPHHEVAGQSHAIDGRPPPTQSSSRTTCQLLLTVAALLCTVSPLFAQTALPHNIPDFSQDTSRSKVRSGLSGNWSSPSTWQGGQLPGGNQIVEINPGHIVTIDSTTAVAYTVLV